MQLPSVAGRIWIDDALTAPVLLALPIALTHVPVARSFAVPDVVRVKVVLLDVVTVTVVVALESKRRLATTNPEPETERTVPIADSNPPNPPRLFDPPGRGENVGRGRFDDWSFRPPPRPPARSHEPFTGFEMATDVAAIFVG